VSECVQRCSEVFEGVHESLRGVHDVRESSQVLVMFVSVCNVCECLQKVVHGCRPRQVVP
jgi:hypothetical protein